MFEIVIMLMLDYSLLEGGEIQSMEGTTQGDPTTMAIYVDVRNRHYTTHTHASSRS